MADEQAGKRVDEKADGELVIARLRVGAGSQAGLAPALAARLERIARDLLPAALRQHPRAVEQSATTYAVPRLRVALTLVTDDNDQAIAQRWADACWRAIAGTSEAAALMSEQASGSKPATMPRQEHADARSGISLSTAVNAGGAESPTTATPARTITANEQITVDLASASAASSAVPSAAQAEHESARPDFQLPGDQMPRHQLPIRDTPYNCERFLQAWTTGFDAHWHHPAAIAWRQLNPQDRRGLLAAMPQVVAELPATVRLWWWLRERQLLTAFPLAASSPQAAWLATRPVRWLLAVLSRGVRSSAFSAEDWWLDANERLRLADAEWFGEGRLPSIYELRPAYVGSIAPVPAVLTGVIAESRFARGEAFPTSQIETQQLRSANYSSADSHLSTTPTRQLAGETTIAAVAHADQTHATNLKKTNADSITSIQALPVSLPLPHPNQIADLHLSSSAVFLPSPGGDDGQDNALRASARGPAENAESEVSDSLGHLLPVPIMQEEIERNRELAALNSPCRVDTQALAVQPEATKENSVLLAAAPHSRRTDAGQIIGRDVGEDKHALRERKSVSANGTDAAITDLVQQLIFSAPTPSADQDSLSRVAEGESTLPDSLMAATLSRHQDAVKVIGADGDIGADDVLRVVPSALADRTNAETTESIQQQIFSAPVATEADEWVVMLDEPWPLTLHGRTPTATMPLPDEDRANLSSDFDDESQTSADIDPSTQWLAALLTRERIAQLDSARRRDLVLPLLATCGAVDESPTSEVLAVVEAAMATLTRQAPAVPHPQLDVAGWRRAWPWLCRLQQVSLREPASATQGVPSSIADFAGHTTEATPPATTSTVAAAGLQQTSTASSSGTPSSTTSLTGHEPTSGSARSSSQSNGSQASRSEVPRPSTAIFEGSDATPAARSSSAAGSARSDLDRQASHASEVADHPALLPDSATSPAGALLAQIRSGAERRGTTLRVDAVRRQAGLVQLILSSGWFPRSWEPQERAELIDCIIARVRQSGPPGLPPHAIIPNDAWLTQWPGWCSWWHADTELGRPQNWSTSAVSHVGSPAAAPSLGATESTHLHNAGSATHTGISAPADPLPSTGAVQALPTRTFPEAPTSPSSAAEVASSPSATRGPAQVVPDATASGSVEPGHVENSSGRVAADLAARAASALLAGLTADHSTATPASRLTHAGPAPQAAALDAETTVAWRGAWERAWGSLEQNADHSPYHQSERRLWQIILGGGWPVAVAWTDAQHRLLSSWLARAASDTDLLPVYATFEDLRQTRWLLGSLPELRFDPRRALAVQLAKVAWRLPPTIAAAYRQLILRLISAAAQPPLPALSMPTAVGAGSSALQEVTSVSSAMPQAVRSEVRSVIPPTVPAGAATPVSDEKPSDVQPSSARAAITPPDSATGLPSSAAAAQGQPDTARQADRSAIAVEPAWLRAWRAGHLDVLAMCADAFASGASATAVREFVQRDPEQLSLALQKVLPERRLVLSLAVAHLIPWQVARQGAITARIAAWFRWLTADSTTSTSVAPELPTPEPLTQNDGAVRPAGSEAQPADGDVRPLLRRLLARWLPWLTHANQPTVEDLVTLMDFLDRPLAIVGNDDAQALLAQLETFSADESMPIRPADAGIASAQKHQPAIDGDRPGSATEGSAPGEPAIAVPQASSQSTAPLPSIRPMLETMIRLPAQARDPRTSQVGGLALLHPWLSAAGRAALLTCAVAADAPEAVLVRRILYARICGNQDTWWTWLDDPLVAVLAGADPAQPRMDFPQRLLSEVALAEQASQVLRAFAAAVPGFAKHGNDLLRQYVILRTAWLRPLEPSGWRIVLAPGMLDVLLQRGGPPMGIVKLPWTPLLALEWSPSSSSPG